MLRKVRLFLIPIMAIIINESTFSQKYDAEIVEYTNICKVDKSGSTEDISMTIQINNRVGDEYSTITLMHSDSRKISDLKAWIEDASGKTIRQLKKSDILERNHINEDLYNDRFLKIFQLKHNVYPYRIVCKYSYTNRDQMHFIDWSPVRLKSIPTLKALLDVSILKEIPFKLKTEQIQEYTHDTIDDIVKLRFSASYPAPFKNEIFSTDDYPSVSILPVTFVNVHEGSWASWKDYGNWIYRLYEGLDELPQVEKEIVANLIRGKTEKTDIIKALYYYMQDHTRYINVSIGIGALKSFPAEYVCRNKYGDCKALSNYMKALLKEAGIPSYLTVINSEEFPEKFHPDFPSHQFNHMILMVPLDNDTLWLENTSTLLPMGYIHTNIQNRYGLLVEKDNSRLVKVRALKNSDVLETNFVAYDIANDGTASVHLTTTFRGDEFEYFTQFASLLDETDKDKRIREMMLFDNYEVKEWKIRKSERDSAFIYLDVNLKLNKFLNNLGQDKYFSLNSAGIPRFTNSANRTRPVTIPYPVNIYDSLVFNLPEGFGLKNNYEQVEIVSAYGKFTLKVSGNNNEIIAIRHVELNPGEYSLDVYPEFYKFIEDIRKYDKTKIVIKQISL